MCGGVRPGVIETRGRLARAHRGAAPGLARPRVARAPPASGHPCRRPSAARPGRPRAAAGPASPARTAPRPAARPRRTAAAAPDRVAWARAPGCGGRPPRRGCERVLHAGQFDHPSDVEGQVADPVTVGEQRLDSSDCPRLRGRGELRQRVGKGLHVAHGDRVQWPGRQRSEACRIATVGAPSTLGAAVEPQVDQLLVGPGPAAQDACSDPRHGW
jgi:hypothetical protein